MEVNMKLEIDIDENCDENKIIIKTKKITQEITDIVEAFK